MSEKEGSLIPKFDGDYEHWALLMENLLRSKEWWDVIETGVVNPERNVILTGPQRTELAECKLRDLKVKNYLFAAIDKNLLKTIAKKDTAKDIWESMKTKFQGNKRVQSAQLQRLRREFEVLEMKEGDTITDYFSKVMVIANNMRNLSEEMTDAKVVEKILRTLVERFAYVVCAIEESKDIKEMSVDELQSSLLVHEQNLNKHVGEEQALKMEGGQRRSFSMNRGRGCYRGGGSYRGGRINQGRKFDKSNIECFNCHKKGHFRNECPSWDGTANYAEFEEDVLLMAQIDDVEDKGEVWYLDSGCSNHMCGNREWFITFDSSFRHHVKLGDDRRIQVEGKGNLRLEINGINQVITSAYYVPGLKNNLLSIGQLQQRGLKITFDENECEVWHKEQKRLLMQSTMTTNRMFVITAKVKNSSDRSRDEVMEEKILASSVEAAAETIWHCRFGHLNYESLRMLAEKEMVRGLPMIDMEKGVCEICMKGKQNRNAIPKQSNWRANRGLELVHSDICGPISPSSESGKRYVINFIDDYSRKCWNVLLSEKSEAFKAFKEFKIAAENELGQLLTCLRTDRGGEFNSKVFDAYCTEHGIRRQLTTAYTPQQNGIAERKNRSIMNMVRCMLFGMKVPLRFWTEAVHYAVYILNRSPTKILDKVTPIERWSNCKPSVEHLRVFGCVAYALIPYERRVKLEEKSMKCVMFGVSKESKAYRLYDPSTKKVIISKDVKFDENEAWKWEEKVADEKLVVQDEDEDENNRGEAIQNGEEQEREGGQSAGSIRSAGNSETAETAANSEPATSQIAEQNEYQIVGKRNITRPAWLKDYVCKIVEDVAMYAEEDLLALYVEKNDPERFEEAVEQEKWRTAMEAEIKSIEENDTWELVDLPAGAKTVGVKWVYKTKLNEKGEVDKFKARLVAKGFHQTHGIDFYEVFAPVARWDTIRLILALAAQKGWCVFQLDVKSAFLHGELKEDVYVEQPKGFEINGEREKVYKLKKALYGLRQAPRAWYSRIEQFFQREGFQRCYCEYTLFVKAEGENVLIISLYVDDLIYTSNSKELLESFKVTMKKEFSMTDLGRMKYFLGVEVMQDEQGIFICQRKYARDMLKKFGMESSNGVRNPMVPGNKLTKDGDGALVNPTAFKQLVGSLRYLTATRPDLIYSINLVSRYMERPTDQHMLAAKRILRYVQATIDFGVQYKRGEEEELLGYVDSDYAGDEDDKKSTSGYAFMFGGAAISWVSKKQPIVTLSTTEAEFVSAANGACQAIWLRNLLEEIGFSQTGKTVLLCDNSSTIKLSKNPVLHGRSKHIHVRYHFLRELVNDGIIELKYCSTLEQLADIMTKAVSLDVFEKLRRSLGVCARME